MEVMLTWIVEGSDHLGFAL